MISIQWPLALLAFASPLVVRAQIQAPPPGSLYHGVFTAKPYLNKGEEALTPSYVDSYEQTVSRKAAFIAFDYHWQKERGIFPEQKIDWILERGSVPHIRLHLPHEKLHPLGPLIEGRYDEDLQIWAHALRRRGQAIFFEFGIEVNGHWFPWNGKWNGAGAKDGYGDPEAYDGPERFRDAYRHLVTIIRDQGGAHNVQWLFHVNAADQPKTKWNQMELYYPGDDWVDFTGVSIYGPQSPLDQHGISLEEGLQITYDRLRAMAKKKIFIFEFGATRWRWGQCQRCWVKEAFTSLKSSKWPDLIGFYWWNESWQNNKWGVWNSIMRLEECPRTAKVFRQEIQGSWVATRPYFRDSSQ